MLTRSNGKAVLQEGSIMMARASTFVGAAMLLIVTPALAQNAPGRVLQKTNMRAFTSILGCNSIGTAFEQLLSPTVITCPGSSTCTLHIEVSSNYTSLDPGAGAQFRVEVDNVAATPGVGLIRVATNNGATATGLNSSTFQFIKTNVAPGNHTVEWLGNVTSGTAAVCNGFQKIEIYTP
jgi:hypothetical protein